MPVYRLSDVRLRKGEKARMLHQSHNLVNFIRNVTCRYHADQLCIYQIGLIRRHASILIVPKYGTRYKVHVFSNSQKIFANRKIDRHGDCRWICMTRFSSDAKSNKDKPEVKLVEEVQQRIIELNEDKLGKLKERVLDVEPVVSDEKEKGKGQTKLVEKQPGESKEQSLKDDVVSKKGMTINIDLSFKC